MVVCPPAPASCNAAARVLALCPQPGFGPIPVPVLPFGSDPSAGHHHQHHGPGAALPTQGWAETSSKRGRIINQKKTNFLS